MVDRQVFIEKSTAGGRNLEKLKDGFSLLACIDYPIEHFDELFGKLQADYGGKIELLEFNLDEGDSHGNYFTKDDGERIGICTMYYKYKVGGWNVDQILIEEFPQTRFEHSPLQGSVGFELGCLLGDRWQPTDLRVAQFKHILQQLEVKTKESEHEFMDCFKLRAEKADGWKLLIAKEAIVMASDVEKWFTNGDISNTDGSIHTLYTESMMQRFSDDQECMELKRTLRKMTVFGLGHIEDDDMPETAAAIKSEICKIIQNIEAEAKTQTKRKAPGSAATATRSNRTWPKCFDTSKVEVSMSNIRGYNKSGQPTIKTYGWIIMPDELYRDLPRSKFVCNIAGHRHASIVPYKSKEMREAEKVQKMSGSNLNTWQKNTLMTPLARQNFQSAGAVGSSSSVPPGPRSNGSSYSAAFPSLTKSTVEQQVEDALAGVNSMRERMLTLEQSAVKKSNVHQLVKQEFKQLAKKFTSIMESFQKEMHRIQKQLDECVEHTGNLEQRLQNRTMTTEAQEKQIAGWKAMGLTDVMIKQLLAQAQQLVADTGKEDAVHVNALGEKLKVGQKNLQEVRAVAEQHMTQMKDAAEHRQVTHGVEDDAKELEEMRQEQEEATGASKRQRRATDGLTTPEPEKQSIDADAGADEEM